MVKGDVVDDPAREGEEESGPRKLILFTESLKCSCRSVTDILVSRFNAISFCLGQWLAEERIR